MNKNETINISEGDNEKSDLRYVSNFLNFEKTLFPGRYDGATFPLGRVNGLFIEDNEKYQTECRRILDELSKDSDTYDLYDMIVKQSRENLRRDHSKRCTLFDDDEINKFADMSSQLLGGPKGLERDFEYLLGNFYEYCGDEMYERFLGATERFRTIIFGDLEKGYQEDMVRYNVDMYNHEKDGFGYIPLMKGRGEFNRFEPYFGVYSEGKSGRESQDACFFDRENNVFAVFDGVGGADNGRDASNSCADVLAAYVAKKGIKGLDDMKQCVEDMNSYINNDPNDRGSSTCIFACIQEEDDGSKRLDYISIGDSRLYLMRDGVVRQISEDEGEGNSIYNCIGNYKAFKIKQCERIRVESGDKIILVSDGITGDFDYDEKNDLMSEEEMAYIINNSKNCGEAVKNLATTREVEKNSEEASFARNCYGKKVIGATKDDDRTAMIVEIK